MTQVVKPEVSQIELLLQLSPIFREGIRLTFLVLPRLTENIRLQSIGRTGLSIAALNTSVACLLSGTVREPSFFVSERRMTRFAKST